MIGTSIRQLPIRDHYLAVKAQISTVRSDFALKQLPKSLRKMILGWAEIYVERKDVRSFDSLMDRISNENNRFLEDLVITEGCPGEHVEECVRRTRALLLELKRKDNNDGF